MEIYEIDLTNEDKRDVKVEYKILFNCKNIGKPGKKEKMKLKIYMLKKCIVKLLKIIQL